MPPPPAGKTRKRVPKVLVIVVVAIVVVAAIIVGLWAAGVGPFAKSNTSSTGSTPPSGSGETYYAAANTANSSTSGVSGGPWTIAGGIAVVLTSSFTINQTELNESFDFGCGGHILSGASSLTGYPGTSSAPSTGLSNLWIIVYANSTGGALEVAVFGGVATPVFTLESFQSCAVGGGTELLPFTPVNSPTVAAAAWAADGPTYAAAHSAFDTEMILVPPEETSHGLALFPVWVVTYTNCNPTSNGATLDGNPAAQFTAEVNATTGKFMNGLNSTIACPVLHGGGGGKGGGKASIDGCQMVSIPENVTGTYWTNASVECPFNVTKMTTGDVTISAVNNTTGKPVSTTGWSLVVQSVSSFPYVNESHYNFATNTWNDTTYPILALTGDSDYWVLTTPTNVSGDRIVITATASAPCTGSFDWYLGEVLV